jgi:hypothetical protein
MIGYYCWIKKIVHQVGCKIFILYHDARSKTHQIMLKLCFEVTLLSVCVLFYLFTTSIQEMLRGFLYVFSFLLFVRSTYMYFLSLAGPIYIHTYVHGFNCFIDIMYISFISFCLCLLPRVFSSFLLNVRFQAVILTSPKHVISGLSPVPHSSPVPLAVRKYTSYVPSRGHSGQM